jgi:hypothetical protein
VPSIQPPVIIYRQLSGKCPPLQLDEYGHWLVGHPVDWREGWALTLLGSPPCSCYLWLNRISRGHAGGSFDPPRALRYRRRLPPMCATRLGSPNIATVAAHLVRRGWRVDLRCDTRCWELSVAAGNDCVYFDFATDGCDRIHVRGRDLSWLCQTNDDLNPTRRLDYFIAFIEMHVLTTRQLPPSWHHTEARIDAAVDLHRRYRPQVNDIGDRLDWARDYLAAVDAVDLLERRQRRQQLTRFVTLDGA